MSKIKILPKHLTELIAAGEVVERPSSVIKELLENSIDAGATAVTVEIKNGGITYMRITDNGCGISCDDVEAAFVSHATSKLRSQSDLYAINTLGFRGEALASIAAVSKMTMLTRTEEETSGTAYTVNGGQPEEKNEAGCPVGTTITVRDLFYNTPARMKFLKKDVTEGNAVSAVVERIALSHPEVSIRFIRDGKQTIFTPGDGLLYSVIYTVLGKQFAEGLVETSYEHKGIKLSGYICKPQNSRPNRSMQFFFINGRLVKSVTCSAALTEAYKNFIMTGKFASCVLHLTIEPDMVDVNVHPAKTEVRFENEKDVFDCVYFACKTSIREKDTSSEYIFKENPGKNKEIFVPDESEKKDILLKKPEQAPYYARPNENFWSRIDTVTVKKGYESALELYPDPEKSENKKQYINIDIVPDDDVPQIRSEAVEKKELIKKFTTYNVPEKLIEAEDERPQQVMNEDVYKEPVRTLGEVFGTFIIAVRGEELLFIDKHAAHERIIFDKLKNNEDLSDSQMLLQPVAIKLTREEYDAVINNLEAVSSAGFEIEDFGDGTVMVRQVPSVLQNENICDIIVEISDALIKNRQNILPERIDDILHSVACRAAVKSGDFTSEAECRNFVEKLLDMPEVKYCPHGRPVMFKMKKYDLEKQFKRKV